MSSGALDTPTHSLQPPSESDTSDSESEGPGDVQPKPNPNISYDIAAHKKKMAEQRLRLEAVQEGAWLVHVHVIEARELRATDPDGTADPVCIVEVVFGEGEGRRGKR